jgi:hypothetical protein
MVTLICTVQITNIYMFDSDVQRVPVNWVDLLIKNEKTVILFY